jgi:hypothetical protein
MAETTGASELTTYKGSCHCGAVRYEVDAKLEQVMACNCSICSRAGYLLTFVPKAQFRLLSGEDAQTDYLFNKKMIHHLFCSTCGVRSFGYGADPQGNEMVAINTRCLEGVDVKALEVMAYDGASS